MKLKAFIATAGAFLRRTGQEANGKGTRIRSIGMPDLTFRDAAAIIPTQVTLTCLTCYGIDTELKQCCRKSYMGVGGGNRGWTNCLSPLSPDRRTGNSNNKLKMTAWDY